MLSTCPASSRLLVALALGALTPACADPSQAFDDFVARSPPPPPPGDCPEAYATPSPGEMTGPYFMTLVTSVNEEKPLALRAELTAETMGSGLGLGMTLQPLDQVDWRTPRGDAATIPPVELGSDGTFTLELTGLALVKEANCVTGGGITADVTFRGNVCGDGSFICGDLEGKTLLAFTGTFTLQRITDEAAYPPALLDCQQTEYTAGLCGPPP